MARKNVFLSAAVFIAFLLLTSPATSQITSDGTPVEIGDTQGLTFIKLAGENDTLMPDPSLIYDEVAETYEVTAAGHDVWDNQSGCAFIYMEVPEACWSAQVSVDHDFTGPASNAWSKGGVMVTDDPTPESKFAFYATTRSDGGDACFQWRDADNGGCDWSDALGAAHGALGYPHYLRLDRVGDDFTGYFSTDGETWQQGYTHTNAAFEDPVHVGFALVSHEQEVATTMTFSNFAISYPTVARAGQDQWIYGGDTVTLDGSGSYNTDTYHWEQVIVGTEPTVTIADPDAADGITTFDAPSPLEVGVTLTFRLTVTGASGEDTSEVQFFVRSTGPPQVAASNLRLERIDYAFILFWDDAFDADQYGLELELAPGVWIAWATLTADPNTPGEQYQSDDITLGTEIGIRLVSKNKHGDGAVSEVLRFMPMRNLALTADNGGPSPPDTTFDYDGNAVSGINNGAQDDSSDSWGTAAETEDWWGYTWTEPLYFDEIAYFTGNIYWDGGWWTSLTVEYTQDGATWVEIPDVQIDPPYDRGAFTRHLITFMTVRGVGIRLYGTPGGMATFTSVAELEVYGDQTQGPFRVQGADAEFPERSTATLDGSHSFSERGPLSGHLWEQVSGPTVAIQNAGTAVASFDTPGVDADTPCVFKYTATDETDTASDEDVVITIKNLVTTAVAGPGQQVGEEVVVTLDGSDSLSTSGTLTYQWTQLTGPAVAIDPADGKAAVITLTTPEIWNFTNQLTFQLEVDDDVGPTSTDEVNVNVLNGLLDVKPVGDDYLQDVLLLGENYTSRFYETDWNYDYLHEVGGEANQTPMAGDTVSTSYNQSEDPLVWTPQHSDDGYWFHDIADDYTGYLHVYILSPDEREARCRFWHDDEVRCWNNGAVAFERGGWDGGVEQPGDFTLDEGLNSMTFKLHEGGGGDRLAFRFADRNDIPYTDLAFAPSLPVPIPTAYAVRALPTSYEVGVTLDVEVAVRADPDNPPSSINVTEPIPGALTVADAGGGEVIGGTINWNLTGAQVGIHTINYSLDVPAGATAALQFEGTVNYDGAPPAQGILGDNLLYTIPSAPTNVAVEMLVVGRVNWSASPEEGVDGYRVFSSVNGEAWTEIAYVTGASYLDDSVVEGSTYSYKVSAVNSVAGLEGPESAPTDEASPFAPSAPTNVAAEMLLAGHVSWSASPEEGVDGYRLYSSVNGEAWTEIAYVTGASYLDDSAVEGSTYSYKVSAVSVGGSEGLAWPPTDEAMVIMETRQVEDFNYGGGLWPWTDAAIDIAAIEAPDSDTLGIPAEYDYYHASADGPHDYRPLDEVGIETALDDGTTDVYHTNIGWTTVGDWWRYTFDVPAPEAEDPPGGWLKLAFRIAAPADGTIGAYWDETPIGTGSYNTGSWHGFTYVVLEAFQTTPGLHTLRVKVEEGQPPNFDKIGIGCNWESPPTKITDIERIGDELTLTWRESNVTSYYIEYRSDLMVGDWQVIAGPFTGTTWSTPLPDLTGYIRVRAE